MITAVERNGDMRALLLSRERFGISGKCQQKSVNNFNERSDTSIRPTPSFVWCYDADAGRRSISICTLFGPITQEKILQTIVDAKAAAKQDAAAKKKTAADKTATDTVWGVHAVDQGNSRCGPGARATSFGEARAADERVFRSRGRGEGAAGNGMADVGSCGRSSPAMGSESSSSGRASPTGEVVVVALGEKLKKQLGNISAPEISRHLKCSVAQAELFLSKGFTYGQVDRKLAVEMLLMVLERHHFERMEYKSVQHVLDEWDDEREEEGQWEDWEEGCEPDMPGIGLEALADILAHYGIPDRSSEGRQSYASGWSALDSPTAAKFDIEARKLAEDCLPVDARAAAADAGGAPAGAAVRGGGASLTSGPSRQAHGAQGDGNRGKKPRRNKNKLAEEGLDG